MKILFLGDIVARPGRDTVKKLLPQVIEEEEVDFVIANGENLTHGAGFTEKHLDEMKAAGVNFFTCGDHTWDKREGWMLLDQKDFPMVRPANFPGKETPGKGYKIIENQYMEKILIINLIGRVFMKRDYDCPFRKVDEILKETAHEHLSAIFVDFHAEATSEKYAMAHYLDGRASFLVGTHTHVPTGDERILEHGLAAISDAGMCGSLDSVIGVQKDIIINSFLLQRPVKHEPETRGRMVLNGVLAELDTKKKIALNIKRIQKIIDHV